MAAMMDPWHIFQAIVGLLLIITALICLVPTCLDQQSTSTAQPKQEKPVAHPYVEPQLPSLAAEAGQAPEPRVVTPTEHAEQETCREARVQANNLYTAGCKLYTSSELGIMLGEILERINAHVPSMRPRVREILMPVYHKLTGRRDMVMDIELAHSMNVKLRKPKDEGAA